MKKISQEELSEMIKNIRNSRYVNLIGTPNAIIVWLKGGTKVIYIAEREKRMKEEKTCETCKYREYENFSQGFVCVNDRSEKLAEWVHFEDTCERWERK